MVNEKSMEVKMLLKDARSFLERGLSELNDGIMSGDQYRIRDAAEKLWNASVNAVNALILHRMAVLPASHWERRKLLEKLEELDPEVEKLGIRDRLGARERYLHGMTFYEGIIDMDTLRFEAKKVEKLIEDIEKLVASHGASAHQE